MLWRHRRRDGFVWKKHVKTIVVDRRARRAARAEALADAGVRHAGRAQAAASRGAGIAAGKLKQGGAWLVRGSGRLVAAAASRLPNARDAIAPARERLQKIDLSEAATRVKDPMVLMQVATYVILGAGGMLAISALTSPKPTSPTAASIASEQSDGSASIKRQSSSGSFFSLFSSSETLSGRATAVTGDTLALDGTLISINGIDAPELTQRCRNRRGRRWRCGASSQRALSRLVRRTTVSCAVSGAADAAFRPGSCTANGQDISIALLEAGRAVATDDATSAQTDAAASAKRAGRGIWSGESESPSAFRDRIWKRSAARAPDGCPIKGITRGGEKTYLMPWTPRYASRRVRTSRGDRWFCSEEAAVNAGWRPA